MVVDFPAPLCPKTKDLTLLNRQRKVLQRFLFRTFYLHVSIQSFTIPLEIRLNVILRE